MFPGGRLEINEDVNSAIKRELKEELGIEEDVYLKYIAENFVDFSGKKYHEIGFYFILTIEEDKYNYYSDNCYESKDMNDGKSYFKWINIDEIENVQIMPKCMKNKVINRFCDKSLEHIVYKEY